MLDNILVERFILGYLYFIYKLFIYFKITITRKTIGGGWLSILPAIWSQNDQII